MLIWAGVVATVDNFVKPWLISQGSDMPVVLILFGVLGGAMAFGFIGVFMDPPCWQSATGLSKNGLPPRARSVNSKPKALARGPALPEKLRKPHPLNPSSKPNLIVPPNTYSSF